MAEKGEMAMALDFNKALKKMEYEESRGNNPIPDILGFSYIKGVFGRDFSSKLEDILTNYINRTIVPKPLLKIDVPKSNFTIRPMARPETKDWLIYEAIIDYLSKKILKSGQICERSFSVLSFKECNAKGAGPWLEFNKKARDLYEEGYKHVVVTDLTGYYENINLGELRKRIIDYLNGDTGSKDFTTVLFRLLEKWSDTRIPGHGLPQGPPASAFLADIFLDHVDRKMEKYGHYFRYMDDIRIFCKKEIDAKLALKGFTIALRDLNLNINAKKTDILCGKEIGKKLFNPKKSILDLIVGIMKSGDKKLIEEHVVPALIKLVEDAFAGGPFEGTHLNFALPMLSNLHNSDFVFDTDGVIKLIESNFVSKPHHAGLFLNFLSMFPEKENIVKSLILFLRSENNIYEWQELRILQTLLKFNVGINRREIDFFMESAKDSNKHYAVRAFYFLLVGKFGNNRDRGVIVDFYSHLSEPESYTKIAVILAVQELVSCSDFYSQIKRSGGDDDICRFVDYVKSLKKPLYYLERPKPKIETFEEVEQPY